MVSIGSLLINQNCAFLILPDNKDNSDHHHSAHLDVKLETQDELLFIEAKCLEWLNAPKKLKKIQLSAVAAKPAF